MHEYGRLGIFVVNYNGASSLGRLFFDSLNSIIRAAKYAGADVWFVDNASSDNSVEVVRQEFGDGVEYLVLSRNVGYGGACDVAFSYASKTGKEYEFYVCSNNDIIVFRDGLRDFLVWLQALNTVFHKGFIAAPVLLNGYTGGVDFGGYFVDYAAHSWPIRMTVKSAELLIRVLDGRPLPISYTDGAFMATPRKVVESRGHLFEHSLFLYSEDVEACLWAWSKGIPSLLVPVLLGVHYRSSTSTRYNKGLAYLHVRNQAYISLHYFGAYGLVYTLAWHLFRVLRYISALNEDIKRFKREVWLETATSKTKKASMLEKLAIITRGFIDGLMFAVGRRHYRSSEGVPAIRLSFSSTFSAKSLFRQVQEAIKYVLLNHTSRHRPRA